MAKIEGTNTGGFTRRHGAGILAACLLTAFMVLAQTPEAPKRTWYENFDYILEIDGVRSPQARLYSTPGRPAMLLTAPELTQALVLMVPGREVQMAERESIAAGRSEQEVLLADVDVHGPPFPYTMSDSAVVFFMDGKKYLLGRRPPLIGVLTVDEVLGALPIYRQGMAAYDPVAADLEYLKSFNRPVSVNVFFGSWCPHCKEVVPRFLKTLSVAGNSNIRLGLTGVPSPFNEYPPAVEKKIKGVPTVIVSAGDVEIGRITNVAQDSSLEHELVKLLTSYTQQKG